MGRSGWIAALALAAGLAPQAARCVPHGSPAWLRFEPELSLSTEGFRGAKWCTRDRDLPWQMEGAHIHTLHRRADEDCRPFGTTARYIPYTYRNSILYGVRLDIAGAAGLRTAMAATLQEYPSLEPGVLPVRDRLPSLAAISLHLSPALL